ncbi:hypothetical protein BC936DRAFT_149577 [Jimgerdemannia flammicorona]|uniref:Uncharacterized protein n=2 Tax=Jimgerdemannia flammicorona TaxID=994334 RepID=A0A433D0J7_9FUNG|nr:hypothetical protein BC936DRAFT_149577 [Jimgerdemannia flammicorona]RUS27641.1 hypothetical protein BC938DRAFT_482957 [Jimgerdemannia flammicorona]
MAFCAFSPTSPQAMFAHDPPPRQQKRKRRSNRSAKPKPTDDDKTKDLLVFGYEARIFDDDDLADRVDRGDFLIPWRGEMEGKIMMDR